MFPFWFDPQMAGFVQALPFIVGGVLWIASGTFAR